MIYVYRVRRLVKVVMDEMNDSTDMVGDPQYSPNVHHCLVVFENLSKRYTRQLAMKTLAIATGEKQYLKIGNRANSSLRQKLVVTSEGIILLTPSGFIKALAESIDASLLIAVLALLVSVLVAIFKH